jgi:D-ribulokinase
MHSLLALGIDVGTSGVRVVATNAHHEVIALAQTNLLEPNKDGPAITQDATLWWLAVTDVLDQLRTMISFERVAAICVDGTSGTIVAVDKNGWPLAPASMYNDASARAAADIIARVAPPETAAHGVTSPLGRAITLQKLPGVARILHQADWVMSQFTGAFDTSDENNALKTGYDPALRVWPQWIEAAGFDLDLMPRVVAVGEIVGTVQQGIQLRFGFNKNTKVVSGTTDGCAAFLATGANRIGDGVTSLGTTMVIKLLSNEPIFAPQFGLYSHRIGDLWLPGGASNSGGAALLKHFNAKQISALEALMNVQEPTGHKYYPLLGVGERFPVYDPLMQSRDKPRPASDAVFLQGLLEGIADVEVLAYQRLAELSAPTLKRVFTVGSGSKNKTWCEIRARKLKVSMEIPASDQAAVGAARLAWKGLDGV